MGNTQSVTITHPKADPIGIQVKKEEANGHAVSGLDLTDAVTCETSVQQKSEPPPPPPPVTVTNNIKPTPLSLEVNGTQATAPTMPVSPDVNEPAKDPPKQPEISSMFSKMFKNKTKPVSPASEADSAAEEPTASAVETDRQKSNPPPPTVVANGIQAKTAVSVEAAGNHVIATAESPESSTPAKDTEISSIFNKMFKKKPEPVPASEANGVAEESTVSAVETQNQESNPSPAEAIGAQAKAAVSVEAAGNHVSAKTVSTDPNTPNKDTPKQPEISSMFDKMFKKKTMPVSPESEANVAAEEPIVSVVKPESQKSNPAAAAAAAASVEANGTLAKAPTISVEAAGNHVSAEQKSAEDSMPTKASPKQPEISSMFNKMFKKKTEPVSPVAAEEPVVSVVETQSQKSEPTDIKANTQAEKVPQGPSPSTTEVTQDSTQPEQSSNEETSVMNFFKTFVSSTKTTKEATASPDVSKEQLKKETPPAPTANVQEASKVPPPPPPAPPKMESKAEPAVKKDEAPPVQVPASAAKEPETPSKTKTKDSRFGKLFRPKSGVKEEAKPVEIQVDASKTSTLEAGAKAEPPPAPKAEEKKAEKKSSPFANLLKPKVLLGQVSSKIHAAATSAAAGISLGAGGAAKEPKKEAPAATTVLAEAATSTKAKEEPKPAAPVAPAAASPDNKSVGSSDNSSPSTSFKLEKRNSIHLFFKNLGQKRHSDAGVQTEPVAPEKAK